MHAKEYRHDEDSGDVPGGAAEGGGCKFDKIYKKSKKKSIFLNGVRGGGDD